MARLNEVDLPVPVQRVANLVDALTESLTVGEGYRLFVEGRDLAASLRRQSDSIVLPSRRWHRKLNGRCAACKEITETRDLRATLANTAAASAELPLAVARLPATLATTEQTNRRVEALIGEADRDLGPTLRDLRQAAGALRALTE